MRVLRPLFLTVLLAWPGWAQGHRLDEYLQATLVKVEPGGIELEMNLTPGVAVAKEALALIDRNGDGIISSDETEAYGELLEREITVRLDGREVRMKLAASDYPAITELKSGWGIIEMKFEIATKELAAGAHTLAIENRHLPKISVYIVNAARPKSKAVEIKRQSRNEKQSVAEIDFDYRR